MTTGAAGKPGVFWLVLCAALVLLAGCETGKGLSRDFQGLKDADAWFRQHYW
ncbi:MAG: hypothetical protein WC732_07535 [Candidatus Omnitrophota bacterium]